MSASLKLAIGTNTAERTPGDRVGFPCTITAIGTGMPSEVFVFKLRREGAPSSITYYQFSHVASLPEMSYPVSEGDPESGYPWIRSDSVKLYHRTKEELEDSLKLIPLAAQKLVNEYNTEEEVQIITLT